MAGSTNKTPGERHVVISELDTFALMGEVYGSQAIFDWRRWAHVGYIADKLLTRPGGDRAKVVALTLRGPEGERDTLLVVKAKIGKRSVVAFHRGRSAADAFEGFELRWSRGTVDWRDDKPWAASDDSDDPDREPLVLPEGV